MAKTLYVSDLDGTLLRSDEIISEYSVAVINELIHRGMLFSYATARSLITAEKTTKGLSVELPSIVYNGAFIIDNKTRKLVLSNFFSAYDIAYMKALLMEHSIHPIVYSYIDGMEKFSFQTNHNYRGMEFFLNSRRNDMRRRPVYNNDDLYVGDCFYFTCIGSEQMLSPIYNILKSDNRFNCIYQKDIYSGELWCEILPIKATKANAILQLKELLKCDYVVSFGDAKNDISMFEISDECYAVANAHLELKAIATEIIQSNDEDGVAKWLYSNSKSW